MSPDTILTFDNVTRAYPITDGQIRYALRDVSFELPSGSVTAIVGRSGSGKSTLLNLAAGIDVPSSGRITLAGRELGNLGDRQFIPLLIDGLNQNPDETVRGMCAWSLGRLGGEQGQKALEARRGREDGLVADEIALALDMM